VKSISLWAFVLFAFAIEASGQTGDQKIPPWVVALFNECTEKKDSAGCAGAVTAAVESGAVWGDTAKNYKLGKKAWPSKKLAVQVTADKEHDGEFAIERTPHGPTPVLTLSMAYSVPEMIMTVNHELVHFANSESLLKKIGLADKKVNDCLSPYDLAVLKDENAAFRNEIGFWRNAPAWFRSLFGTVKFNPKMIDKKQVTFEEYYTLLAQAFKGDAHYASKRYISLKRYPTCALKLLSNSP
jgi:hypothetical protein